MCFVWNLFLGNISSQVDKTSSSPLQLRLHIFASLQKIQRQFFAFSLTFKLYSSTIIIFVCLSILKNRHLQFQMTSFYQNSFLPKICLSNKTQHFSFHLSSFSRQHSRFMLLLLFWIRYRKLQRTSAFHAELMIALGFIKRNAFLQCLVCVCVSFFFVFSTKMTMFVGWNLLLIFNVMSSLFAHAFCSCWIASEYRHIHYTAASKHSIATGFIWTAGISLEMPKCGTLFVNKMNQQTCFTPKTQIYYNGRTFLTSPKKQAWMNHQYTEKSFSTQ